MKKLLLFFLVIALLVSKPDFIKKHTIKAYDSDEPVKVFVGDTNADNLINDSENGGVLLDKLEYDRERHETDLNVDVEEQLNEAGLFDEDIKDFNSETINDIKNAEEIMVSLNYFKETEKENVLMSEEEIDEVIDDKIQDETIDYSDDSAADIALKLVGFKPVDIKAKTKRKHDKEVSPSGALKSYLIVTQKKKNGKIKVSYTATWLKDAYYKNKDVVGINYSNFACDKRSIKCEHYATEHFTDGMKMTEKTIFHHTKPTAKTVKIDGLAFTVNLFGKRPGVKEVLFKEIHEYSNERIIINCKGSVSSEDNRYCLFASSYHHLESNKSLTPSVSIGADGISVSISGESKDYYHIISGNAYVKFKHL